MPPYADIAPNIVGSVTTLVVLGAIAFALRIYVRSSNRAFGWDDWCMVVAAVPWAALSLVCIIGAFNGVGVEADRLSRDEQTTAMFWFWLFEILWCLGIVPVKLSIAFMLGRIAVAKRPWVIALYMFCTLLTIVTLAGMVYIIFRCTPISYAWDTSISDGTCQPVLVLTYIFYVTNAVNIATDWFCALLPIPLLWDAPLDIKSKISVGVLLSLGVLASIAACVRQRYTSALTSARYDVADLGNIVIWGYAEVGIGFLVGSLSTLRPLLARRNRSRYPTTHHDDDEDSEELCDRAPAGSEETARTDSLQRPREDSVMSAIAKAHTKPISRTSSEYADIADRTPHETAQLSYRISSVPTQSIAAIPMRTVSDATNEKHSPGRKPASSTAHKQNTSPVPKQTIGLAY